jgi:hypothetical protein
MSEEILKVFLADLKTVRVVCQHCKAVIELDVAAAGPTLRPNACPLCKDDFSLNNDYNAFVELTRLVHHLELIKDKVTVEFPVKLKP